MDMRIAGRRAVVATVGLISVANIALADDSGVHAFFLEGSGQSGSAGAEAAPPVAPAAPVARSGPARRLASDHAPTRRYRLASVRPLTVHRQPPKAVAGAGPAENVKVSIYTDPTLRVGDAVMTADGIRIFASTRPPPYAKSDFVTIAQARDLSRDTVKVLAALNEAPRT